MTSRRTAALPGRGRRVPQRSGAALLLLVAVLATVLLPGRAAHAGPVRAPLGAVAALGGSSSATVPVRPVTRPTVGPHARHESAGVRRPAAVVAGARTARAAASAVAVLPTTPVAPPPPLLVSLPRPPNAAAASAPAPGRRGRSPPVTVSPST